MIQKLTCYIIDDEPLAREILETYIDKVPFLELQHSFSSPLLAASSMKDDQPDLLFLDIDMPDLNGLTFIPMLSPRPLVILTTAYGQYALKAYDLEVVDYLLKPIGFERFYKGVLRVYQSQSKQRSIEETNAAADRVVEPDYIFLKVGTQIKKIALTDILFIEGMRDYLRIHTLSEKIMILTSFSKLEALLPTQGFTRVHKSYMIAISKIDHIEKNKIWIAGQLIPISETYYERFLKLLKGL